MIKIAIYSGTVPSTTFIERLIKAMSNSDATIYLFGHQSNPINYDSQNIIISTYSGKFNKFFRLMWFSILLFLFKNKDKKSLDKWIISRNRNTRMLKIKSYPVLWYNPDVFHLQWAKSIEDWIWVQQFGIKLIISLRGSQINVEPFVENKVAELYCNYFPKVDAFHAVSIAIAKEAEKYGANPEKIKIVYSGLPKNQNTVKNTTVVKEIIPFQILSVGRAHWIKGYNYALDSCAILKKQGFQFHYSIIGAKDVEELEFQKNNLGLNDCVTFSKNVSHKTVLEMMQKADLLLLPSVEEGIANVILEAMQLQKTILTTNCGGMEEIVTDGKNGFLMPIRNPELMSQKIIEVSRLSKKQLEEIGYQALKTIDTLNTKEKMVTGMKGLYNFVLEKSAEL